MRSAGVILFHPRVQISLQRSHRLVDLLTERDLIELVQARLVEPFLDPVRLRMLRFCPRVLDVVQCQEQLVLVSVGLTAVLSPTISQDPQKRDAVVLENGMTRSFLLDGHGRYLSFLSTWLSQKG